jgi:hypothetical protein
MRLLITIVAICFATGSVNAMNAGDLIKVVPGQSIQAAIDVAGPGDTIEVKKGVYIENLWIDVPRLTLKGKGAIIDGEYHGPCITVDAQDVTISGFRLVNGIAGVLATGEFGGTPDPLGGDVPPPPLFIKADDITLIKNEAIACMPLGGFLIEGEDAHIEGNTVRGAHGYGIWYRYYGASESQTKLLKNTVLHTGFEMLHHFVGPQDSPPPPRPAGNGIDAAGGRLEIVGNRSEFNAVTGIRVEVWNGFVAEGSKGKGSKHYSRIVQNIAGNNGSEQGNFPFLQEGPPAPGAMDRDGIWVFDNYGLGTLISKNVTHNNADDGIKLRGWKFDVQSNKASWNLDDGIDAEVDDSVINKNVTSHNSDDGLRGHPPDWFGADDEFFGNRITNNTSVSNADEGIQFYGSNHYIGKNKANDNLQCGIRVADGENVMIAYNTTTKNGHQGISNSAHMTDIMFNKSSGNACGIGPDIAGEGDGWGDVDDWADNKYDTGGRYTQDRCHEPD